MTTLNPIARHHEIQAVIAWLKSQGLPVLPVAPAQNPYAEGNYKVIKENPESGIGRHCPLDNQLKPIPKYTGKNPSYISPSGLCQLVNHRAYQSRLPSNKEVELWYACFANGIGTLGGWNNTIWLDFDTKQFCDQDACNTAVLSICDSIKSQTGEEPFLEKSHSGGWHVGVRVNSKPNFTNFALKEGGKHVGEALGEGRFVVLAPTIGPSGKSYESINRCNLPVVESLESIGIYPVRNSQDKANQSATKASSSRERRIIVEGYVPNAIPLESLGNDISRQVLTGGNPYNDRSQSLTAAIKEWYGWENWARANHVTYSGTAEQLAAYAGGRLGIDGDRVGRILKTIDPDQCHPAALSRGTEDSCWKKIRRLSKEAYESYCPPSIKSALRSLRPNSQPPTTNNRQPTTNNQQPTAAFPVLPSPDPEITELGLVAAVQKILDRGLSEAETRCELIGLARVLKLNRSDVEAIAKELETQSDRTEDLETDALQFQKLVNFRDRELNLNKIFPRPLAQALLSKAESSRLDPIRLVQNLLPAAGTMLGNHVRIIAKYGATSHDHWYECGSFWCADVSPPSSGKSDAQRSVFAALKWIESQEFARVDEAKKQLQGLEEKWKLFSKEEKIDLIGTADDPDYFKKNNVDNQRRYLWDEVTTEALFKLISKQPENSGSCLLKDELEGLFRGMDQFKQAKGNGIQQLLSAWSGPLTGSVDRVDESKSYRFNNQTLNICGSIQPEVARNSINVSNDPDGLASRMLFGVSKLPDNFAEWSDVQVDMFNGIRGLLEGLEQMSGTLEYSDSAYKLASKQWTTLKKGYEDYLDSNPAYAYYLGKQNSYLHRFALLLHCIEHYYEPKANFNLVCLGTLQRAIMLSNYYCGQFRLLQATAAKPDQPQLDALLYQIWERIKSVGKCSTRDLCQFARRKKWRGEKITGAAALDILKTIANCGLGVLKDKTLYYKAPTPTLPVPPAPEPDDLPQEELLEEELLQDDARETAAQVLESPQFGNTSVGVYSNAPTRQQTGVEDECGQCSQMPSDCQHPQSEEESGIELSVDNCGQTPDIHSEFPNGVDVVEEEIVVVEEPLLEQSFSTSPDDRELEQPNTDAARAETVEPVESAVVEPVEEVVREEQQEPGQQIVVGSKVYWPQCPAHWEHWAPFVVEFIQDDGMVKLEMAQYLVPLAELILIPDHS